MLSHLLVQTSAAVKIIKIRKRVFVPAATWNMLRSGKSALRSGSFHLRPHHFILGDGSGVGVEPLIGDDWRLAAWDVASSVKIQPPM
jgi:hypothetical protein